VACNETTIVDGLADLTATLRCLADLLEAKNSHGLAVAREPRYKAARQGDAEMVDEMTMAAQLGIQPRTLGEYRRRGKFPGCWLRNGKKVLWRVQPTIEAWTKGIP
jgi:hypothetical protein